MKELLKIKKLNMHYPIKEGLIGEIKGYVYALNNIDIEIYENEILGLVGESGSGKSTLGNCILKLIEPTSGEICYRGEDILKKGKKELKGYRKEAQLIFQNPYMSLNPRMRIIDILKEPFIINGIRNKKEIEKRIEKIVKLIGLEKGILNRYPHEFSGGQRQRIAIARAIILEPRFIVADEPVSALDVSIQAQIINLLKDLKENLNLTMLFISHDLSIVKYISDRIAVMYLGEIAEIATKEEFFSNNKHPYTEALLNSVPDIKKRREKKQLIEGELPTPSELAKGCKFHSRCPYVMERCKKEEPELKVIKKDHLVRCFLIENK